MSLGFGLLSAQIVPGESDWRRAYQETVELAVEAERLGYSSVWTTEHHFVDDGYMPSLLVVSAALAAATSSIEIATGVILAPLHDPIRLAEDAATVQLLSDGRLVLGLGLGWNPIEFEGFGKSPTQRGKAMTEILDILKDSWTGQPFQHSGSVYDLPQLAVRPIPHRPIPVVIGGSAEPAIRRAARQADGIFSNASPDRFVQQVAWVREELEQTGRSVDDFRFIYYTVLYPGDNVESATKELLPHFWPMTWKYSDMEVSATRPLPVADYPTMPDEKEFFGRSLVAGPGPHIVETLQAVRDQVDVPVEFVTRSYFPTMDLNQQKHLMEQLAAEVLPHL